MDDLDSRTVIEGPGLLESIRQYRLLAIVIVSVFAMLGIVYGFVAENSYTATSRIGLVDPTSGANPAGSSRYAALQAQFVHSDEVLVAAASELGMSKADLSGAVDATAAVDAPVLFISCTRHDAQKAATCSQQTASSLKTAIASDFKSRSDETRGKLNAKKRKLTAAIEQRNRRPYLVVVNQNALQTVEDRLIQLDAQDAQNHGGVQFLAPALVPPERGIRSALVAGAVGAAVGAVIALLACWIIADRRRKVEDSTVPGLVTGARLLGEVPVLRGTAASALNDFTSMPAAPFGFVAASLWSSVDSGVVLVSGADRAAGATTTAVNVAAAFARDGRRVVLVDADGRGRTLSQLTGVDDAAPGLSDVLTRRAPLEDSLRAIELGDASSVAVLPAGQAEADLASLLRAKTMAETMERLREWYDLIVVDCPPATDEPEAASLARYADGLVFVVACGTQLRRVERLQSRLEVVGVAVLGYVFNRDSNAELTFAAPRTGDRVTL